MLDKKTKGEFEDLKACPTIPPADAHDARLGGAHARQLAPMPHNSPG